MKRKDALIFGAGGFAGPYLARELSKYGYRVVGSDLVAKPAVPPYDHFIACDLTDAAAVERAMLDVCPTHVFNLAAVSSVKLSWNSPQKTVAINVGGALNVLEAARKCAADPRVLLIGSSEEYERSENMLSEQSRIDANSPYGLSKVCQEQFSCLYRTRYGMKIYHVRPFNHTGIGQSDSFVVPGWCRQVAEIDKSGKPGAIKVGNLKVRRDFSDVRDVVRAYRMVIESDDCETVYNIGSGRAIPLNELLARIVSLSSQAVTVETDPALARPVDNPVIWCDNRLIRERLGWTPIYDLEDTVRSIYRWYRYGEDGLEELNGEDAVSEHPY